ncbi:Uncharacterized protein PBTT_04498 [Plasmodiophora brassicae]|uniref:Uncharacterized protein n=1 Tax=Plasmodiophora brassicae TaxID=37360 RepID=A0A0G4IYS2_PLABS|nr:hypothetical protein PBRA_007988 [Plasmodiophora brassicae]SPQ96517.1 unnamed protein product [Plasmodiophora brassicae]
MLLLRACAAVLVLVAGATCVESTMVTFVSDVWPIISALVNASDPATAYLNMVGVTSPDAPSLKIVQPGNHQASSLWQWVSSKSSKDGPTPVTRAQQSTVATWIDSGAVFQVDGDGTASVPGPNGGAIRGGNTVSVINSTYMSVVGTAAVLAASLAYLKIKL